MAYRTHNPNFDSLEKRLFEDICRADPFFIFEFTRVIDGGKKRRRDIVEEDMSLFRSYFLSPQYFGKYSGEVKSDVCMTLKKTSDSKEMSDIKGMGLLMDDFGIAIVTLYAMDLPKKNIPEKKCAESLVFAAKYLKGCCGEKILESYCSGNQGKNSNVWHFDSKHDGKDCKIHMFDNDYSPNVSASMAKRLYLKNVKKYAMV